MSGSNSLGRSALWLGNAGHYLHPHGRSWKAVLQEIARKLKLHDEITEDIPFLLQFEGLSSRNPKKSSFRDTQIKSIVAQQVIELPPHPFLKELVSLPFNEFLTTNYDYAIERAISGSLAIGVEEAPKAEILYSAFRRRKLGAQRVWHVHGEAEHPDTIMLGFEHYAGQLAKLRTLWATAKATKAIAQGHKNWVSGNVENWTQIFFSHNVHVLGFGCDFSEIVFWWIITYRSRVERMIRKQGRDNRLGNLTVHLMNGESDAERFTRCDQLNQAKKRALESLGCKVLEHTSQDGYSQCWTLAVECLRAATQ
jgi:hypothetical protein